MKEEDMLKNYILDYCEKKKASTYYQKILEAEYYKEVKGKNVWEYENLGLANKEGAKEKENKNLNTEET